MVSIFEAASAAVRIRSAAAIASDGSTRTDLLPVWDATDASAAFGAHRSINIEHNMSASAMEWAGETCADGKARDRIVTDHSICFAFAFNGGACLHQLVKVASVCELLQPTIKDIRIASVTANLSAP